MTKWILIGVGVVVAIIIIVLVLGLSNLGPIIKKAVNTYGPEITKTELQLGDVDISIFSAEASLNDFYLGNPQGFKSPQAMGVRSIYVNIDRSSLTKDTIVIDKIEVIAPNITYEKAPGTDNFKTILYNVKKSVGADSPSEKKSNKKGEGKKILIKDLIVKDGTVNLAVSMVGGKSISASLPDIHLKDLGTEKGGASPAEVFEIIFSALHKQITSPAVTAILNKELKGLGTSLEALSETAKKHLETLGMDDKKAMEAVTDKIKGFFDK